MELQRERVWYSLSPESPGRTPGQSVEAAKVFPHPPQPEPQPVAPLRPAILEVRPIGDQVVLVVQVPELPGRGQHEPDLGPGGRLLNLRGRLLLMNRHRLD